MGFFDELAKNAALWAAVEASKDKNGKPDPYKAAGMEAGMGNFSFSDRARLGAMLGSQGVFDTDTGNHYSGTFGSGVIDNGWRDFCEDGSEYGIDPEDYETEEGYEAALLEAKRCSIIKVGYVSLWLFVFIRDTFKCDLEHDTLPRQIYGM